MKNYANLVELAQKNLPLILKALCRFYKAPQRPTPFRVD